MLGRILLVLKVAYATWGKFHAVIDSVENWQFLVEPGVWKDFEADPCCTENNLPVESSLQSDTVELAMGSQWQRLVDVK